MLQSSNCKSGRHRTTWTQLDKSGHIRTKMTQVCATSFRNFNCLSLSLLIPVRAYPRLWTSLFLLISVGWPLVLVFGARGAVCPLLLSKAVSQSKAAPFLVRKFFLSIWSQDHQHHTIFSQCTRSQTARVRTDPHYTLTRVASVFYWTSPVAAGWCT